MDPAAVLERLSAAADQVLRYHAYVYTAERDMAMAHLIFCDDPGGAHVMETLRRRASMYEALYVMAGHMLLDAIEYADTTPVGRMLMEVDPSPANSNSHGSEDTRFS